MSAAALFIALSSMAWAGVNIAKKSIGAKKLKDNAANSRVIKDGAVRTQELKDASVTTPKLADNAVTGDKADESTFGQVPSAASADTATTATTATTADNATNADNADQADNADTVNGVTVQGFRYFADAGGGNVELFSLGGVTVTASCPGADDINLTASNGFDDAVIHSYAVGPAGAIQNQVADSDWNDADADKDLVATNDNDVAFTFQYAHPAVSLLLGSSAVSATFQVDTTSVQNSDCVATGHVMRSASSVFVIGP